MMYSPSYIIRRYQGISKYGGAKTFLTGARKFLRYKLLQRHFEFKKWHTTPIEWRPYALETVKIVNDLIKNKDLKIVVEIGCGLGEILNRLIDIEKYGYDVEENVINAARHINQKGKFLRGSFDNIDIANIDILITMNFMHDIPVEELKECYKQFSNRNIRFIIVDTVDHRDHRICHDFDSILNPFGFIQFHCSETFENHRRVQVYKNAKD